MEVDQSFVSSTRMPLFERFIKIMQAKRQAAGITKPKKAPGKTLRVVNKQRQQANQRWNQANRRGRR